MRPLTLKKPRIDDQREGQHFTSAILPPYMRRSPGIDALIPVLYIYFDIENSASKILKEMMGSADSAKTPGGDGMTSQYLTALYDYDSTVNRQVLDLLRHRPTVDTRTRQVIAHLLTAKKVWITRLRGEDVSRLAIWPELSWPACEALIEENRHAYTAYLQGKSARDLETEIAYTNSKGVAFRTPVRDILMHVLIHSGYHRGQLAAAVRAQGGEPINTDYIAYVRAQQMP